MSNIWKVMMERLDKISEMPEDLRGQTICSARELCNIIKKSDDIPAEAAIKIKELINRLEGIYPEISNEAEEALQHIESRLRELKVSPVGPMTEPVRI